jgi:hypothetical protein
VTVGKIPIANVLWHWNAREYEPRLRGQELDALSFFSLGAEIGN